MTALLMRTPARLHLHALPRPVRRPADRTRPGGRGVSYGAARTGRAARPTLPTLQQVRRRVTVLASAVLVLVAVAVAGVAALVSPEVAEVPAVTTVTQVQRGESLSEVAVRAAPGSASAEVVAVIQELNSLSGSTVRAGQSLLVPAG